MAYLYTMIETLLLHHYSIAMETYAALFNCTMVFIDNGAACNTPIVKKDFFHILKNKYTTIYNAKFPMLLFTWGRKQHLSKRRVIYCGVRVFETIEKAVFLTSDVLPVLYNTVSYEIPPPQCFQGNVFVIQDEFQW